MIEKVTDVFRSLHLEHRTCLNLALFGHEESTPLGYLQCQ